MIILVVDAPSSVEINAGESHWRPIYEASTYIMSMLLALSGVEIAPHGLP